jgi:hypothetical protein
MCMLGSMNKNEKSCNVAGDKISQATATYDSRDWSESSVPVLFSSLKKLEDNLKYLEYVIKSLGGAL